MEMPQPNNQDSDQKIPSTPHAANKVKISKRRRLLYRYGLPVLAIVLLAALASAIVVGVEGGAKGASVQEKPISTVLNLADNHQLASVTINGNDIQATGKNGQHYHAVKEDGQSVSEILRRDGVSVSVSTGQDLSLIHI